MISAILALELSTPTGRLAVLREGDILHGSAFTSDRSHNSKLYAPLAEALEAATDELDLIVVGTGPGSYTGVRIAIAAAHGVALSRGVPVIGLPSLATVSEEAEYFVIGDARRGLFYTAHVSNGRLEGALELHEAAALEAWNERHAAMPRFTMDATVPLGLAGVLLAAPQPVLLARQAARLSQEEIHSLASQELEPLYITEAFITTAKKK